MPEIGLVLAFDGAAGRGPAYVRDVARSAEAHGFHSIWVPEHVVFFEHYDSVYPYPPSPGSTRAPALPAGARPSLYDPLFTCMAMAAATSSLRVGTAVALVPLRHPLLWAREVAALDHFTDGRFSLGVGVGWLGEEFEALNVPFAERGRVADEHLGALRAVWSAPEGVASFSGAHVSFTDAVMLPAPVSPGGPPILVGGNTDAALRRVARYGDGWYAWNLTPGELSARLERLAELLATTPAWDGRTRSLAELEIQVGVGAPGSLDDLAALVAGSAALGATRVTVTAVLPPSRIDDRLGALAAALDVHPPAPPPPS